MKMDRYSRARVRQVGAMLFVYAIFYVCRLAFSASKKGMIEQGAYTPAEIGYVGSAMLFAYAIGKIVNGFIADRVNVKKYIMLGLFVSALANFLVGFHIPALMLAVVWFVNGFAQASGAPCCVVALSRWWPKNKRGNAVDNFRISRRARGGRNGDAPRTHLRERLHA